MSSGVLIDPRSGVVIAIEEEAKYIVYYTFKKDVSAVTPTIVNTHIMES